MILIRPCPILGIQINLCLLIVECLTLCTHPRAQANIRPTAKVSVTSLVAIICLLLHLMNWAHILPILILLPYLLHPRNSIFLPAQTATGPQIQVLKEMEAGTRTGLDQVLALSEYLARSYGYMVDRAGLSFLPSSEPDLKFFEAHSPFGDSL